MTNAQNNSIRVKRYQDKHKEQGLCIQCSEPAVLGKTRCVECLSKRIKLQSKNRIKALENGLCYGCFILPCFGNTKRCQKCFAKNVSKSHFKTGKHWLELLGKLKAQNELCAYSGRTLVANEMELDHIIPLSRGGANEVSNVHWVLASVNRMKRNLLEPEFFALINDIRKFRDL